MLPKKPEGRQAHLPETLEVFRIGDMDEDDVRHARTYAMRVTQDGACWLDSTHPTSLEPTEDMPMIITRTLEGFCVTVTGIADAGWELEDPDRFNEYYGDEAEWLPVVHIFDSRVRL